MGMQHILKALYASINLYANPVPKYIYFIYITFWRVKKELIRLIFNEV